MKILAAFACVLVLGTAACGSDTDPSGSLPAGEPSASAAVVDVAELVADGQPRDVAVSGFMIWEPDVARLCELILESAPPQCGGASVVIVDPEVIDEPLDELNGVKWTPSPVTLNAQFDGTRLTVAI